FPDVPPRLVDAARVPGIADARQWGDADAHEGADLWGLGARSSFNVDDAAARGRLRVLALSGGGANGAFAAGVLTGLTTAGAGPNFQIWPGLSPAALPPPFLFLAPSFDGPLRELFTDVAGTDLVEPLPRWRALFGESLASAEPLRRLIEQHVD